jgi:predicted lipoprotein with Yx(FWY)xxD motif
VFLAGCGGGDLQSSETASTSATDAAAREPTRARTDQAAKSPRVARAKQAKGTTVKVVGSQYGPIVSDGRGQAFYAFARETSSRSRCYGACAQRWPPVITKGRPRAGPGGHKRLLGTTRRADGRLQVTYSGHPMYYYLGDAPGRILCQGVNEFGGLWLVVRASGKPVI